MAVNRLIRYLDSIRQRDPAPRSRWEVMLYAGVWALALHRLAFFFFSYEFYFLARAVSQLGRFLTGVEIHPGARIGARLFIDHGMGVVIGETAEIGDDVTLYHGVTLGGVDPTTGVGGKRHPTLLDGVIVGAGAQILGPVTVGRRARIGANAVVTRDVPEGATMVGIPAKPLLLPAETYAREFIAYGTPCDDRYPAEADRLQLLRCELERLQARLAVLEAQQELKEPLLRSVG